MAIRSKPTQMPAADTRQIDAIIDKGGSVATEPDPKRVAGGKLALIQLRLPPALVKEIDRARRTRTVPPSRHAWMLEAILDKLGTD